MMADTSWVKQLCVLCDIDGTLANVDHRRHFVESRPANWQAFYQAMPHDTPIVPVVSTFHALQRHGNLKGVLFTGRPDSYRDKTEAWLAKHAISYDWLLMRKATDYRPDEIVKLEMLKYIQARGWQPHVVIDDRDKVVAMWRDQGLVCLQAAPGDF